MSNLLEKELDDIKASYDLLIEGIEMFEIKLRERYIPHYSHSNNMARVIAGAKLIDELNDHVNELNGMHEKWRKLISGKLEENATTIFEEETNDHLGVEERTNWFIEDNLVRVETIRKDGETKYPNIIPKAVFGKIVKCILNELTNKKQEYISKSAIGKMMRDQIISETNYKKSPDTVVYSVIKVLLKEEILKKSESHQRIYLLNVPNEAAVDWLSKHFV